MTPLRHGRQLVAALAIGCAVWLQVAAAQPAPPAPPAPPLKVQNTFAQCVADAEPYLALDYRNFDQGVSADGREWGWREISNKPGCETAAADLMALWMQRHGNELTERIRLFMSFHEGQVRAMGGQFKRAAVMIEAGRGAWPSPEGAAYVDAILAFLRYDRPGLMAARERLMAVPEPRSWPRTQEAFRKQVGRVPLWPQNIESVDRLIECFGKGYTGGVGGDCEWRAEQ